MAANIALSQKRTCATQMVMSALPPKADMCGATGNVGYGPIADIVASAILNDFAECMFAVWALKGAFIVSRFVRLDPREPHASSAFRTSRQVENKASRIEDIFRLRHRC